MILASFVAVIALILVHTFAHRLRFLDGTPRSRWLSAAGGISLAYVFLHLLPELAEGQTLLAEEGFGISLIEFEIYGLALVGLLAFYGIERTVRIDSDLGRHDVDPDLDANVESAGVEQPEDQAPFWLHLSTFGVYNLLIGYLLLHRGNAEHGDGGDGAQHGEATTGAIEIGAEVDLSVLFTFALAMGLHFLVTDYGLREDFRRGWLRTGRWVLSGAVVVGWLIGLTVDLPEIVILGAIALLGGGVILNVLKEELPEERQSRFGALVAGAAGYTVLLAFAH